MAIEIVKAKPQAPSKFLIMGEPFSGKTTLAAKAPAPLFISTDGNAAKAGLAAVNVTSSADVSEAIRLFKDHKEYKTLVFDTIEGIVDIIATETLADFKRMGMKAEGGGELKSLADMSWGKGTAAVKKRVETLSTIIAGIQKNVIILSYTKRRSDDISGSIVLDSELKDIRLFTKFMDAQIMTIFDGEKYFAKLISRREIMAGDVDLGEIESFLPLVGWELPRIKTKVGKAQKR
jgi:hypothetical protein